MEMLKYRRFQHKKFGIDYMKYIKELEEFNDLTTEFWEIEGNMLKSNSDNKIDRRRWNSEKNQWDYYASTSKYYTMVDPYVVDNKNIQYQGTKRIFLLVKNKHTGNWQFPTSRLYNGDSFRNAKTRLLLELSRDRFRGFFPSHDSWICVQRDFYDYERKDPKNANFVGVKTFYYKALHWRGQFDVEPSEVHPYDDYVLATKDDLNKYLEESYYKSVIHVLNKY